MTIKNIQFDGEVMIDTELKLINVPGHRTIKGKDLFDAIDQLKDGISTIDLGAIQAVKLTITVMGRYDKEEEKEV